MDKTIYTIEKERIRDGVTEWCHVATKDSFHEAIEVFDKRRLKNPLENFRLIEEKTSILRRTY